ncbi:MAG: hypothetical protein Unbinned3325contig1000_58 [Prokaryotic dsDNA virus sp.]|nr:MAG: hypothetical protein Unbinned3325contig1000_58 [Prokaryotic dsDNA virus sp.]|tara:strand:- start:1003 stop:1467 length:465 start_codon:yes stop_codon:yes gene_type:complete
MAKKRELDEQDRRLLTEIIAGMSFDSRIFAERLGQEINRLTRSGVDEQSIIGVLSQDFNTNGRIFGELKNAIKRGVVGGINQAFRRAGEMGKSLKWVTMSKNPCSDCKKRAGEVDTWDNWESRGMPSSGWSICKEYCYCQLMPADMDIDDTIII